MRRHLRTDAMQIERRRNQGSGVWGRDTSTEQVRFQKSRQNKLMTKDLSESSQARVQLSPSPLAAACAVRLLCAAPLQERLL